MRTLRALAGSLSRPGRRAPGFAALVVAAVAVAVFATSAAFAVVESVLLRPLPFAHPDRVAMITRDGDVGLPDGVDWREQSRTFQSIALFLRSWAFDLSGLGDAERLNG